MMITKSVLIISYLLQVEIARYNETERKCVENVVINSIYKLIYHIFHTTRLSGVSRGVALATRALHY